MFKRKYDKNQDYMSVVKRNNEWDIYSLGEFTLIFDLIFIGYKRVKIAKYFYRKSNKKLYLEFNYKLINLDRNDVIRLNKIRIDIEKGEI